MDINFFQQKDDSELISKNSDGDKFQKIFSILCDKRKKLEETLQSIEQDDLTEIEQNLLELKDEMKTFGISELDYQKYLAIKAISENKKIII